MTITTESDRQGSPRIAVDTLRVRQALSQRQNGATILTPSLF